MAQLSIHHGHLQGGCILVDQVFCRHSIWAHWLGLLGLLVDKGDCFLILQLMMWCILVYKSLLLLLLLLLCCTFVHFVLATVDEEEVLVKAVLNAQLRFDSELLRLLRVRVKVADLLHAPYKFLLWILFIVMRWWIPAGRIRVENGFSWPYVLMGAILLRGDMLAGTSLLSSYHTRWASGDSPMHRSSFSDLLHVCLA